MDDNFIYQKKDFLKLGIADGSFNHLIKKLDIDNSNFMCFKVLQNGIKAKFFNEEAMKIVLNYKKEKENSNNKNELMLLNQNTELKQENQKLQNAIAVIETKYTKEITELKDEWHKREIELLEKNSNLVRNDAEKDKQIFENQVEFDNLEDMSIWQFIKWKNKRKKNSL